MPCMFVKKNENPNKILLVATFRHFFIGLGLALKDRGYNYHLVFINQNYDDHRNPILNASLKLKGVFASVFCLPLNVSGAFNKYRNRNKIFSILRKAIRDLEPVEIATGNDRRIEYQYAMYYARVKQKLSVKGAYLDNGVGSYVNFHKLEYGKFLARKWIDIPVKKLVYGFWYTRMQRYGGSDWTDICYLTHPEYAPARLLKKDCRCVDVGVYRDDPNRVLDDLLLLLGLDDVGYNSHQSILLVLPKVPAMALIYGSVKNAEVIVKKMCENYKNVYIKYHPADLGDVLNFKNEATILPNQIPVELLFINMDFSVVIGDGSTAVLSAKWMLPGADVGFFDLGTPYVNAVRDIFIESGITPINPSSF